MPSKVEAQLLLVPLRTPAVSRSLSSELVDASAPTALSSFVASVVPEEDLTTGDRG